MEVLGIDIGGTGIKGAPVNLTTGELLRERYRLKTPKKPSPEKIAKVLKKIVDHFEWRSAVGVGFPGVVERGQIFTAANLHPRWVGLNAAALFSEITNCAVSAINDADAAGLAEIRYGAGKNRHGKVMLFTLGTGIGSALFLDGKLVPNTELGHLEMNGKIAEAQAAERVRVEKKLSWKNWTKRVTTYLELIEFLFSPDLIILGGGGGKHFRRIDKSLKLRAEVVPAYHGNLAGIIGAALAPQLVL